MPKKRGKAFVDLLAKEIQSHRRSQGKRTMDPLLMRKYPTGQLQSGNVLKLGVNHPPLRQADKIGNKFGPGPALKGTGR